MTSSCSPISTVDVGPALTCNLLYSCNFSMNSLIRSRNVSTKGYMLISTVVTTAAHLRNLIFVNGRRSKLNRWIPLFSITLGNGCRYTNAAQPKQLPVKCRMGHAARIVGMSQDFVHFARKFVVWYLHAVRVKAAPLGTISLFKTDDVLARGVALASVLEFQ